MFPIFRLFLISSSFLLSQMSMEGGEGEATLSSDEVTYVNFKRELLMVLVLILSRPFLEKVVEFSRLEEKECRWFQL